MQSAATGRLSSVAGSVPRYVPGAPLRYAVLIGLLLVASVAVSAGMRPAGAADAARWPTDDAVFAVDGWQMTDATVETAPAKFRVVSRAYTRPTGGTIFVALWTSPDAKRIYRADPEVPFVNAGYTVEPVPADLVPPAAARDALLLRKDTERVLELHTYGERRGTLGSGFLAWGLATFDALTGRPNDYYLVRVLLRLDQADAGPDDALALARTLVPRLQAWYAAS